MNDKINLLKEKIQQLINRTVEVNNHQKTLLNFLFKKLEEVRELETLERLKEYENGKYLKAYLLYKSITRANYQPEHLKLTQLENVDKCLEMIEKDLEANQPKEEKHKELSNQQLLTLLSERIKLRKIALNKDKNCLFEVGKVKQPAPTKLFLESGEIEYSQVEEFLKKHGLNSKK